MFPYYLFFLYFFILTAFDFIKDDKNIKILKLLFLLTGFLLQLFFIGFRYKIASDWVVYTELYQEAMPLNDLFSKGNLSYSNNFIEPGFQLMMSFFKTFGCKYHFMVFAITLFNTISLYLFLKRINVNRKLTLLSVFLILYIFRDFDILRQSIAFNIMLFAFSDKPINKFVYFFLVILAMSFHYSACIYIIFYFFNKISFDSKKISLIIILFFVSLFVTFPIITTCLSFADSFTGGLLAPIVIKFQGMIDAFSFKKDIGPTSLLNLVFLIILYFFYRRKENNLFTFSERILVNFFLFYILINISFKEIQEVADRFSYYFTIGVAVIFALLPKLIKIKEVTRISIFLPILFIMMRLYLHFNNESRRYGFTPYTNFLLVDDDDEIIILKNRRQMENLKSKEDEQKKN